MRLNCLREIYMYDLIDKVNCSLINKMNKINEVVILIPGQSVENSAALGKPARI